MKNLAYFKCLALFLLTIIFSPTDGFCESVGELFFQNSSNYAEVAIEKVLSADTIRIKNRETIRLIGIKASKPPKNKQTAEKERDEFGFVIKPTPTPLKSIEERTFEYAKDLLEGKKIRIEFDSLIKNEEHQTLGYVFLVEDNLFVNEDLLRQGFVTLQLNPVNTKYNDRLKAAYKEARDELRGIHGE